MQATGGDCYQIKDLGEGFELLEAEAVASLRARRGGADKPLHVPLEGGAQAFAQVQLGLIKHGAGTQRTASLAPSKVVPLSVMLAGAPPPPASLAGSTGMRRIMHELAMVARGDPCVWLSNGEGVHIFPGESDATRWRVLLEAPSNSPFAGGVFALVVALPTGYPTQPPTILFETPVYHCNVSDSGTGDAPPHPQPLFHVVYTCQDTLR